MENIWENWRTDMCAYDCICTYTYILCNCISLCIISYDCFQFYKPINLSHIQTPGTACPEAKKMLTTCKMGCDENFPGGWRGSLCFYVRHATARRLRENLPTQAVSAQRRKSPGGGDGRNPQGICRGSAWDFLQLVHGAAHSWVHQFVCSLSQKLQILQGRVNLPAVREENGPPHM